jgi:hypothetical protein
MQMSTKALHEETMSVGNSVSARAGSSFIMI